MLRCSSVRASGLYRRVAGQTVEPLDSERRKATLGRDELHQSAKRLVALVASGLATDPLAFLCGAQTASYDRVALSFDKLCRLTTRVALDAFSTSEREREHQRGQ